MVIVVGDIGGTNTRLALAEADGARFRLMHIERFPTPAALPQLLQRYLHRVAPHAPIAAAAFCGAGPPRADGAIALTNHPCVLEPGPLAAVAGAPVTLINDFAAVAHAIPVLDDTDLRQLGGGPGIAGAPKLALGAGTGLGVASLVADRGNWCVLTGEGGHADLAPVDDDELAIWLRLRAAHGALCAETILSGSGVERLYTACGGSAALDGAAIASAAAAGDPAALHAVQLFTRWLGRVSANAALTLGARGGVYIAGGIVPAWGDLFDPALFRAAFEDKSGFADWLRAVPSAVICHPQPALLGLARLASTGTSTEFAAI